MADDIEKIRPEDEFQPSDKILEATADVYRDFYEFRNQRSGSIRQFQNLSFEDYLKKSRELFWNSTITQSEDLKNLGLDFSFPFVRKEVLDFLGRIVALNISPQISGDNLSMFGVKVLQAIYKKWRLKSKDRVEKFWQVLYGIVNGTVCIYVGFDSQESKKRFLTKYDPKEGNYQIDEETIKMWNDVRVEIVPIEEMYLQKIWQRDIQKQGKTIRRQEMTKGEFMYWFGNHPNSQYVHEGQRIAEDSLYIQLLGGTGVVTTKLIEVLTRYDTEKDEKTVVANGIPVNTIGKGKKQEISPNPFHHKMQPYVWSIHEPIDEKFAYGLSLPFKTKDGHNLLNSAYTMMVEQELRAIDPPYLTSDIESPDMIFGQKKVIPVMDVDAYKPIDVREASGSFYTMMNSLQGVMTSHAQGGHSQIAPSRQPTSAREIVQLEKMKQQALGNTLVLYFDMVYQELMLVLKTALQFYSSGHYANQTQNLVRTITVPEIPLMQGGTGRMEVRVVKEPQNGLKLYFEAVQKSIQQGKTTEIIEIPHKVLRNLEFYIDDISLEPEKADEIERAAFFEQVLQPMLNFFVPAGLADPAKVYLRYLEKMGEHPASYSNDQAMPQLINSWGQKYQMNPIQMSGAMGQPEQNQAFQGRQQQPAQIGNLNQSTTGQTFGGQSNGGYGAQLDIPE